MDQFPVVQVHKAENLVFSIARFLVWNCWLPNAPDNWRSKPQINESIARVLVWCFACASYLACPLYNFRWWTTILIERKYVKWERWSIPYLARMLIIQNNTFLQVQFFWDVLRNQKVIINQYETLFVQNLLCLHCWESYSTPLGRILLAFCPLTLILVVIITRSADSTSGTGTHFSGFCKDNWFSFAII